MAMAEIEREATFSDKSKQKSFAEVFFHQKQSCLFCDVILKVCSKEIHAHSNVLAASSSYFENFLSQDLPRLFSQRHPQIIEIQIDGNEPNKFYEEAVETVINFIYTGNINVKEYNVAQIYEISKIMDITSVINFCEDFIQGKVQHGMIYQGPSSVLNRSVQLNTDITSIKHGSMLDCWASISKSARAEKDAVLLSKLKTRKVTSVSTQTVPIIPLDKAVIDDCVDPTETPAIIVHPVRTITSISVAKKRGRPPAKHKLKMSELDAPSSAKKSKVCDKNGSEMVVNTSDKHVQDVKSFVTRSGRKVIAKFYPDQEYTSQTEPEIVEQPEPIIENIKAEPKATNIDKDIESDINEITLKVSEEEGTDQDLDAQEPIDEMSENEERLVDEINDSEMDNDGANDKQPAKQDELHVVISKVGEDDDLTQTLSTLENDPLSVIKSPTHTKNTKPEIKRFPRKIVAAQNKAMKKNQRNYSCSECDYVTKSVREMTNHTMTHKMEKGLCFYCDLKIPDRNELLEHLKTHTGDKPFQCRECKMQFKTRTMMNLHLPKHSNYKPYVCHICSMSFKWKHALTCHFTTHSDKKEHLCDICGFTTAWKAQLKAHKLIHFDMTFKCDKPGCGFQTTKKQNLKYHEITHTGERKNMCEICGQKFSLKRNMRRHMLLHFTSKQHKCDLCDFASTRMDKLKEHLFKQHGKGTPPERRFKIAELQQNQNLTLSATGNFISVPDPAEAASATTSQPPAHQESNLFSVANMPSSMDTSLTTVTPTLSGDHVITIIKEPEQDSYAILNNLLNQQAEGSGDVAASGAKNVIIQQEEVGNLHGLQEFTAQQLEASEATANGITEQVINIAPGQHNQLITTSGGNGDAQTFEIISDDAVASLTQNASLSEQTIQIIDNDQMQFVKVEDLASRLNLPDGFTLAPVSMTGQSLQIIREMGPNALQDADPASNVSMLNDSASQYVVSNMPPSQTETIQGLSAMTTDGSVLMTSQAPSSVTSTSNGIMTSDHTGIVTSMNHVLIQRPDGSEMPVEFIK